MKPLLNMAKFRKWLLAGLLVLAPLIITIWVLEWVVSTLDKTLKILPAPGSPISFSVCIFLAWG